MIDLLIVSSASILIFWTAIRNCSGLSAFRSLRNSMKNSSCCGLRRTSVRFLENTKASWEERMGWWPWILLQLGSGQGLPPGCGAFYHAWGSGWMNWLLCFFGDIFLCIHPKIVAIIWQPQWKRRRGIWKQIMVFLGSRLSTLWI